MTNIKAMPILASKKSIIRKSVAFLSLIAILFFSFAFTSISASAEIGTDLADNPGYVNHPEVIPLAGEGGGGGGMTSDSEDTFQTIINFFVTWFKRIGLVVALVGAIMFALAIKDNNAEQKQAGLMTLIAGLAVAAICQGVDMFKIFD